MGSPIPHRLGGRRGVARRNRGDPTLPVNVGVCEAEARIGNVAAWKHRSTHTHVDTSSTPVDPAEHAHLVETLTGSIAFGTGPNDTHQSLGSPDDRHKAERAGGEDSDAETLSALEYSNAHAGEAVAIVTGTT